MLPLLYLTVLDDQSKADEFEKFVNKYQKVMIRVADDILHNYHDAEEVTVDALVAIAKKFSFVCDLEAPRQKAYACRTARNKAIRMLNSRNVQNKSETAMEDIENIGIEDKGLIKLCEGVDYEFIVSCIENLPNIYKDIFVLHYLDGMSTKKIADELCMKRETIKTRLKRGRDELKLLLINGGNVL